MYVYVYVYVLYVTWRLFHAGGAAGDVATLAPWLCRIHPLLLALLNARRNVFRSDGISEGVHWIVDEAKKRARPRVDA